MTTHESPNCFFCLFNQHLLTQSIIHCTRQCRLQPSVKFIQGEKPRPFEGCFSRRRQPVLSACNMSCRLTSSTRTTLMHSPLSAAARLAGTPWTGPTGPLSLAFRAGWPPPRQMTQVPACGSNYSDRCNLSFKSLTVLCIPAVVLSHSQVPSFPSPLPLPALSPFPPYSFTTLLLPGLPNFLFLTCSPIFYSQLLLFCLLSVPSH